MMGNYSEEYATFNASPITIIQSLQISERENETRSEMGGRGGREEEQQRGEEMKGYFFRRRRRPTVLDSFRFNKGVGSFKIVFSLVFLP